MFIIIGAAIALTGCQTDQQDRVLNGAVIGGVAGTAIGVVAGHSIGGAVAGGLIGAATTPGHCYRWHHHRRYRIVCY